MRSLGVAVLTLLAILAFAQSEKGTSFSGRVTDTAGGSIGHAIVSLHWNVARANGPSQPATTDSVVSTDMFGEFSINLTPGFYDLCVHAAGFSAVCETVAIGERPGSFYKTVLKPDPLITKERADIFEILDVGPNLGPPTVPADKPDAIPTPPPDSIPIPK